MLVRTRHVLCVGALGEGLSGVEYVNRQVRRALDEGSLQATWQETGRGASTQTRGSVSARNLLSTVATLVSFARHLVRRRPAAIYMPLSQGGPGLMRDMVLVLLAWALSPRARLVFHLHGEFSGARLRSWERQVHAHLARRARAVFLSCVPGHVYFGRSTTYVPNSLARSELARIRSAAAGRPLSPATRAIVVGPFTREKGALELWQAHQEVVPKADWHLVLSRIPDLGADPELASAMAYWQSLPDASISPGLYGDKLLRAMVTATHLVLPSRSEGAPILILEALAMGMSVVAPAVGAVPALNRAYPDRITTFAPGVASSLAGALKESFRRRPVDELPPQVPVETSGADVVRLITRIVQGTHR